MNTNPATLEMFALPAADPPTILARLCGGSPHAWARLHRARGGTARALLEADREELRGAGIEAPALERLALVRELAQAYGETPFPVGTQFNGSTAVYQAFRERLPQLRQETFIALSLDNKHRLIRERVISVGSLTASIVHPRDVFRPLIADAAAAVVFLHNHPSGDPTPSAEDLEITRRLREVGEVCGIRCLDHVIIGAGRFVSFVDDGYWS